MKKGLPFFLSSFLSFFLLIACTPPPAPSPPPNVLLVTIDTFRADRLGAGLMPALDRLADAGARFTNARSAVPLTLPSHASILTGLLPPAHGVRQNGSPLADAHPTIARLLKNRGYQTAAFVGAFVLDRHFGLAQGFDAYDDRIPRDPDATERLEAERPASAVVDAALSWLGAHLSPPAPPASPALPAPFFVWIHLYDPHAPYVPPAEFLARARAARSQSATSHQPLAYDGELAYADSQIARVFDWLRAQRVLDRTLIVVAGDHGEGLGDHGERTHGMLLYDATLRVPLVIVPGVPGVPGAAAGRSAARVDEAVSLVDIAPTILHAAGVAPPVEMKGRDLLARRSLGEGGQADLYSETEYPSVAGWSPLQALTDGRWKTIRGGSATEVYDLKSDPQEERDLVARAPDGAQANIASVASAMSTRLASLYTSTTSAGTVSPETAERLRSLGYVAGTPQPIAAGGAPHPSAQMPAWTRFEDALSALNARLPSAAGDLQRLAREHPEAPVFATTYARALKDAGRAAAAVDVYRAAARRWPADGTLLHDLAVAAREASRAAAGSAARALRDEAALAEQAALALSPGSAMAHNGLGLLAADADRSRDAAAEFERATALDPSNGSYWTNLGNARRAMGDRAGAEQAYRRALDVVVSGDAGAADAANGLGVLLVETGRAADAAAWFERALAAAPDLVEARLNLGIARQQSGDATRAAAAYRAVIGAPGQHPREKDAAKKLLAQLGAAR